MTKSLKIALIGHGNTGKEIEKVILEGGAHQLVSVSTKSQSGLDLEGIKKADVVIDFSLPEIVIENIKIVSGLGKNIVMGTTGWYERIEEVRKIVDEASIGLIYGQNFGIGANIFFKIVSYASKLASKFGKYDVYGLEVHHTGKKDSPSGTALKVAEVILDNFPSKTKVQTEKLDRKIEEGELHFASIRGGRNPGMHQVVFDSEADSITLTDQAHSRKGFAQGAILAAEFIAGKKGLHSFDELFSEV